MRCSLTRMPASAAPKRDWRDRKSTRLNSSHSQISYAVFCLKKKKMTDISTTTMRGARGNRTKAAAFEKVTLYDGDVRHEMRLFAGPEKGEGSPNHLDELSAL